ncbi:MAG: hypothetical protein EBU06_04295 [Micrococcales bacterium]|nr:hypothetical protein [Micrococcales bacterium]NBT47795.1 hypothetical protein [Actinomycetota bacterium]NBY43856.1 hypothetical protein [Micrococcales bacterium]
MRFAETLMRMTEEGGVELPFPAFFFGLIAFTIFTLLVIVTWSYRDVANRHEHKVKDSNSSH